MFSKCHGVCIDLITDRGLISFEREVIKTPILNVYFDFKELRIFALKAWIDYLSVRNPTK